MAPIPSTERFSDHVENYIKYRPSYSKKIISFLVSQYDLTPDRVVADIASGTGKLTKLFLENGNTVFAVEPNATMRKAAEVLHGINKNFISINGTAEKTTLPGKSVDLIIAAQSFHWFDLALTRAEFKRIARTDEIPVVILWNERPLEKSGFAKDYEDFLLAYSTDYAEVGHQFISSHIVHEFFNCQPYGKKEIENFQPMNLHELNGLYLSCSYALPQKHERFNNAISELEKIFMRYQQKGKITMEYVTRIYSGYI